MTMTQESLNEHQATQSGQQKTAKYSELAEQQKIAKYYSYAEQQKTVNYSELTGQPKTVNYYGTSKQQNTELICASAQILAAQYWMDEMIRIDSNGQQTKNAAPEPYHVGMENEADAVSRSLVHMISKERELNEVRNKKVLMILQSKDETIENLKALSKNYQREQMAIIEALSKQLDEMKKVNKELKEENEILFAQEPDDELLEDIVAQQILEEQRDIMQNEILFLKKNVKELEKKNMDEMLQQISAMKAAADSKKKENENDIQSYSKTSKLSMSQFVEWEMNENEKKIHDEESKQSLPNSMDINQNVDGNMDSSKQHLLTTLPMESGSHYIQKNAEIDLELLTCGILSLAVAIANMSHFMVGILSLCYYVLFGSMNGIICLKEDAVAKDVRQRTQSKHFPTLCASNGQFITNIMDTANQKDSSLINKKMNGKIEDIKMEKMKQAAIQSFTQKPSKSTASTMTSLKGIRFKGLMLFAIISLFGCFENHWTIQNGTLTVEDSMKIIESDGEFEYLNKRKEKREKEGTDVHNVILSNAVHLDKTEARKQTQRKPHTLTLCATHLWILFYAFFGVNAFEDGFYDDGDKKMKSLKKRKVEKNLKKIKIIRHLENYYLFFVPPYYQDLDDYSEKYDWSKKRRANVV